MTAVQERYVPEIMPANSTVKVVGQAIGGFICTVDGTLDVLNYAGTALLDDLPVVAGIYYPLPIYLGPNGGSVVLAGGAAGTLLK